MVNGVHVHPPKVEMFDLVAKTNTDPKGFVRPVDRYRVTPFGLYLARPMIDHPRIAYVESWLLPELGIRISDLHLHAGHDQDFDFYLDIAAVQRGRDSWLATDHYLDILLHTGRGLDVVDTDELLAALGSGLLDQPTAQRALETTYRTADGLAGHGYDLEKWLAALDIHLDWLRK
ncbi:MAG TPA: DUF402 domain-containing protein [Pseudonocardiaceae bacterium]|nr:DUF402 domain-containing protein [Pseudonocardiaceae bacterium]